MSCQEASLKPPPVVLRGSELQPLIAQPAPSSSSQGSASPPENPQANPEVFSTSPDEQLAAVQRELVEVDARMAELSSQIKLIHASKQYESLFAACFEHYPGWWRVKPMLYEQPKLRRRTTELVLAERALRSQLKGSGKGGRRACKDTVSAPKPDQSPQEHQIPDLQPHQSHALRHRRAIA